MLLLDHRHAGCVVRPVPCIVLVGVVLLFGACYVTPPPAPVMRPLPTSPWNGSFRYRADLQLGSEPSGAVPLTAAVVRPHYRMAGSALGLRLYRKVAQGFAASMGVDQERIIISKGMKVKGPFPSFDEMTYSDKNTADLALAPTLFIEVDFRLVGLPLQDGGRSDPKTAIYVGQYEPGKHWMMKAYEMIVSGWISFVLHEPLSGVKLWIKKLELDEVRQRGVIAYAANYTAPPPAPTAAGGQSSLPASEYWTPGEELYDGRTDSMATALKTYYEFSLKKLVKYIDPQELLALQQKVQEIRAKVRVGESR